MEVAAEKMEVSYTELSRLLNDPDPKNRPHCIRRGRKYIRFTQAHCDEYLSRFDTMKGGAK